MIDCQELEQIVGVLEKMDVQYYIHAGVAVSLHGMDGELDDCDIRIFHPDIKQFYLEFKKFFPEKVKLRGPVEYSKGIYDNYCVMISGNMKIDICAEMVANCDIGRFEFPLNEFNFKNMEYFEWGGIKLPVASLESLFLYYLVLRRTEYPDGKKDEFHVREMLNNERFDKNKFIDLIENHCLFDNVLALYNESVKNS